MRSKYFTFLYSECKRLSDSPVNSDEIKLFIDISEGQRGFEAFCALHNTPDALPRPQSFHTILESFEHE